MFNKFSNRKSMVKISDGTRKIVKLLKLCPQCRGCLKNMLIPFLPSCLNWEWHEQIPPKGKQLHHFLFFKCKKTLIWVSL
jgi:hypothetical protein